MRKHIHCGVCRACGYDLRGIGDSRCPECGTAFDPGDPSTYCYAGLARGPCELLAHARLIAVVLAALWSSFGGPLILSDLLAPHLGRALAFSLTILPVLIMLFSVLNNAPLERLERFALHLGVASSLLVLSMQIYGAWHLATRPRGPDAMLHVAGIVVGTGSVGAYLWFAHRSLREHLAS